MFTINLYKKIENRLKTIATNYKDDYNLMFSDIISYKISQIKKSIQSLELDFYE